MRDSLMLLEKTLLDPRLMTALQDIATNVEIDGFCIKHPHYKPLELLPDAVERLQSMPLDLQQKYISSQLRSFLYGIYYNGSLKAALAPESETQVNPQDLENNTVLGMDLEFYEQIHHSNTGEGYFDESWVVVREEDDGAIAVTKSGLTLHIKRDRHLKSPEEAIVVGNPVAIRLPKNLVQNGFYMAVSNAGVHDRIASGSQLVRIYWSLTPEGAVAVMNSLTQKLNEIDLPFTFKVLYNPSDYKRHDSGVLYFDSHHYESVRPILQSVYTEHRSHFLPEIPLFTKLLAPGLGLAEEPTQRFAAVESFGMNRCQIVANGLLAAQKQDRKSTEARFESILNQFDLIGVAIATPYLNAESSDIYVPLNK
ncbi:T3SS effector HopA1 family protein [Merismopedia glauca]|uniref:Uncharacterized protein n=1 Tax=Merismopedia glauca CCAP 1448/3 TaxID=1296344 RepID=A0A2T1C1R1_9CYAN|nr:T3SS effector HopA1 family protein [Merismopedia glauca]PSB02209.1 hypothetical protein C7B64_14365 [Merismopedia glauca CCAP 1448/3]